MSAYIPIVTPRGTTVAMQQLQFAAADIAALEEGGLEALEGSLPSIQATVGSSSTVAQGSLAVATASGVLCARRGEGEVTEPRQE